MNKLHHPFIPPVRKETFIIPSWAAERTKKKFIRRMDKTYHNINRLGIIKEINSTIFPCDTTPQTINRETGRKGASSWVDAGGEGGHQMDQDAGGDVYDKPDNLHNVDVVGWTFGGTLRDQKEKRRSEKYVKIEKLGVVTYKPKSTPI